MDHSRLYDVFVGQNVCQNMNISVSARHNVLCHHLGILSHYREYKQNLSGLYDAAHTDDH